jgi:hypothetical protein
VGGDSATSAKVCIAAFKKKKNLIRCSIVLLVSYKTHHTPATKHH